MTLVAVIVPTLVNKEGGYEALESIKGSYDIVHFPIIVDNWRNPDRCLSASWNWGAEIAQQYNADYLLFINDDVLFSPWTLTGLVRVFQQSRIEQLAMVTGVNLRGGMRNPEDIFNVPIPPYNEHDYAESPDFSCFMMTPFSYEKVGKFDENFRPAYFEDNDYHRRINLSGMKAICSSWAPYYHYGSVTQNFDQNRPIVTGPTFDGNREYYKMKWGGEPGLETYSHPYGDAAYPVSKWK